MDMLHFLVDVEYSPFRRLVTCDGMWQCYDESKKQYIHLNKKDGKYGFEKFSNMMEFLEKYYMDSQYSDEERICRIKKLSEIQLDQPDLKVYENLTTVRYPLMTVRGVCTEDICFMPSAPVDGLLPIPCCFDRRIALHRISMMEYPQILEILLDAVNWLMLCPKVGAVYILHDSPANTEEEDLVFTVLLQIQEKHIRVITDPAEIKRIYEEYR